MPAVQGIVRELEGLEEHLRAHLGRALGARHPYLAQGFLREPRPGEEGHRLGARQLVPSRSLIRNLQRGEAQARVVNRGPQGLRVPRERHGGSLRMEIPRRYVRGSHPPGTKARCASPSSMENPSRKRSPTSISNKPEGSSKSLSDCLLVRWFTLTVKNLKKVMTADTYERK